MQRERSAGPPWSGNDRHPIAALENVGSVWRNLARWFPKSSVFGVIWLHLAQFGAVWRGLAFFSEWAKPGQIEPMEE